MWLMWNSFENAKEMKKHLQTHSYKKANFKCVDCEFVGTNEETMEVHIGKTHADIFVCGLCDYKAENPWKVRHSLVYLWSLHL